MKAFICVDYLSHSWDAQDLLCSYSENKQQVSELRQRLVDNNDKIKLEHKKFSWRGPSTATIKEQHRLAVEENRLKRLQNALWRQMSKRCTDNLGKSNRLVDPWEVNWQKECDITWLYGPLYQRDENNDLAERCLLNEYPTNNPKRFAPPRPVDFCPSRKVVKPAPVRQDPCATLPSLKPALKYRPSVSRHAKFDSLIESWTGNAADDDNDYAYHQPRPKRSNSWTGTHVSAPRASRSIRFNPQVRKLEFIPSLPVLNTVQHAPPPAPSTPKTRSQDQSSMPPMKRKSPVALLDEPVCPIKSQAQSQAQSKDLSEACINLAGTVKDIVALCGVIVIYRGISVGVSPVVWLADHWVQHLAGRDVRV